MVRHHGLNHGPAGTGAPARPAHHLGEHLKGGFRRPEGTGVKAQIRVHRSHQRYIGQVQTLGNHLGSQEDLFLPLAEAVQNCLVGIGGADGVRVHPGHRHLRKEFT